MNNGERLNIYEKMSAITAEISAVAKNLEVGYGQGRYKATGEADVLAAVKPLEAKYKVYSYPAEREIVDSGVIESTDKSGNVKRNLYLRIKTAYRFVDMEKPDDYIVIYSYSDGVDPQDKAPGKAMTYGDKYALLKAYKIITGDDPDQHASEPLNDFQRAYPSRDYMIQAVKDDYDADRLRVLLEYYNVASVDALDDVQLAVAYNKRKGTKK